MKTIKADEVQQKIASNEDVILINALGADSFRAKHIPGSINIPAGKVTEIAEQVLPDKDQEIIVYCSAPNCTASPSAAKKLLDLGYTNVSDFEAGLTGWLKEGFGLVRADAE